MTRPYLPGGQSRLQEIGVILVVSFVYVSGPKKANDVNLVYLVCLE